MNTKVFKHATIVLMLAGCLNSCAKKGEVQNITLQYQKCECDYGEQTMSKFIGKNVLLLDAEKVTDDEILERSRNSKEKFDYIICDFALGEVFYRSPPSPPNLWDVTGYICNFPFDFSWDIPKNGIYVSFTADAFIPSCHGWSPSLWSSISDLVLTSLKIQTK
jgi:hypothetical protein